MRAVSFMSDAGPKGDGIEVAEEGRETEEERDVDDNHKLQQRE